MVKVISLGAIGIGIAVFVDYVYKTAAPDDIFFRLSVSILAGLYAGLLFLIFVLPVLSEGFARLIYQNPPKGEVEEDPMREARCLQAKGNYVEALSELRQVVIADPKNRMAWGDMSKVQLEHFGDVEGAARTLKEALTAHAWAEDDAAFLMFRLSEVLLKNLEDRAGAVEVLKQVIAAYPDSQHAAHATHSLRELGAL